MLILAIAIIFLPTEIAPILTQQDSWPSYTLSASAVRGLAAAFELEYGRSPQSIEPGTRVHIVQSTDGVLVRFEHAGGADVSLSNVPNGVGSTSANLRSSDAEVVIPALEAAAITITFAAWKLSEVAIPQSRTDFDNDRFTVSERAILNSILSRPGYFVTYSPPSEVPTPPGLYCGNYMNYRVDPSTWEVFRQPSMC